MNSEVVDKFLAENKKKFPEEKLVYLVEKLRLATDSKEEYLKTIVLREPSFYTILSITVGWLGVDRFAVGDIGLGILKLITLGCYGMWWFIDIFLVSRKAKEKNFVELMIVL